MLQINRLTYCYPRSTSTSLFVPEFSLAPGKHAIILGRSGSGKSTLLHLIAAILTPQSGTLRVAGTDLIAMSGRAADAWRGKTIGFLPQKLALIPSLSVQENILLPTYASGASPDPKRADMLLNSLGLTNKGRDKPYQLSQGQQQRVAIARAMLLHPKLLLTDEPTANLDDEACTATIRLLTEQASEGGASLVIATHDARVIGALPTASVLRLDSHRVEDA